MSYKIIGTSVLILGGLVYSYIYASDFTDNYKNVKAEVLQLKSENAELKQPSQVEIDKIKLDKSILDYDKYKKVEEEAKKQKEISKWKERCFKKKIIGEVKNCTENLEQYAEYSKK